MLIKQGGQLIQDNLNLSQQLVNQILNIAVNLAQCILDLSLVSLVPFFEVVE